jgi:hypothetical protein
MLIKDKITEFFCVIDDFFKIYFKEIQKYKMLPSADGKKHRNRNCEIKVIFLPRFLRHFSTTEFT